MRILERQRAEARSQWAGKMEKGEWRMEDGKEKRIKKQDPRCKNFGTLELKNMRWVVFRCVNERLTADGRQRSGLRSAVRSREKRKKIQKNGRKNHYLINFQNAI
ncbi:MAG: hypothetical protein R6V04_13555 [bacterium]